MKPSSEFPESNIPPKTPYRPKTVSFPFNAFKQTSQISSKDSTSTTETRAAAFKSATDACCNDIVVSSKSELTTTTVAVSEGPRRPAIEVEKAPKEDEE